MFRQSYRGVRKIESSRNRDSSLYIMSGHYDCGESGSLALKLLRSLPYMDKGSSITQNGKQLLS